MVPSPPRSRRTLLLITVLLVSLTKVCLGCDGGEQRALLRSIRPLFSREFGYYGDWNESADCCDWEGVGCRRSHVVSLSLVQVGIGGALDGTVFAPFTELQELDLSMNEITGFSSPPSTGFGIA